MLALSVLPEILRTGTVTSTSPDRSGRSEIKSVHAIEAEVTIAGGEPMTVRTYVRETTDGRLFYDLTGSVGAGRSIPPTGSAQRAVTPALEGGTDALNLEVVRRSIKRDDLRAISRDVQAEIEASGLSGKVTARVVEAIEGFTATRAGV